MKKFAAIVLSAIIFIGGFSNAAPVAEKMETVYVNLDYYGTVQQINVFNSCVINGQKEIIDYGVYESVSNLTNRTESEKKEDGTSWNVDGVKNFAYTGKVNNSRGKDVPWKFNVSYKLNGVTATPEELLGKSGLVEVNVDIDANTEANNYYRNNYLLEITGSYDMNDYLSVESDDAMFITSGKTKTLMFIVLPGQSVEMSLKLGTEKFEMDGLTFAIVPLEGELFDKVAELTEDKKDFEDAMESINDSTDVMLNVLGDMTGDLKQVASGMSKVKSGTDDIYALAENRDANIAKLKESLVKMQGVTEDIQDDLENIKGNVKDLTDMMEEIQPKIEDMSKHMKRIESNLEDLEDIVEDLPEDIEEIQDTLITTSNLIGNVKSLLSAQNGASDIDTEAIATNLRGIAGAAYTILGVTPEAFVGMTVEEKGALIAGSSEKAKAVEILTELGEVQTSLNEIGELAGGAQISSAGMMNNLNRMQKHLDDIEDMLNSEDGEVVQDSLANLKNLMKKLRDILNVFSKYNQKFIDSKRDIPNAIDDLNLMLNEINEMDKVTVDMVTDLQKTLKIVDSQIYEGANDATTGLINTIDKMTVITDESGNMKNAKDKAKNTIKNRWDKIDEKTTIFNIDTNAKPVSFTSGKNDSPKKVQFMLKTPDIKELKEEVADLESTKDNGTFWSRLLAVLEKMFGWILRLFK